MKSNCLLVTVIMAVFILSSTSLIVNASSRSNIFWSSGGVQTNVFNPKKVVRSKVYNDADYFQSNVFKFSEGKLLNYRIHIPEDIDGKKKYPLVPFLHGAGERGNDNDKQLSHGVKDILAYSDNSKSPVIIVAPQCPSDKQWVSTPWGEDEHTMPKKPSEPMMLTIELLKELKETIAVDTKRIYVTGLAKVKYGRENNKS